MIIPPVMCDYGFESASALIATHLVPGATVINVLI
jgi:hypothetical protein